MYIPRAPPTVCIPQPTFLPQIDPRYTPVQHKSADYLMPLDNSYLSRRLNTSLAYSSPNANYPLYPQDLNSFIAGYPNSLYYNRPIRYFFQRPVQLDEQNCFPHQKKVLDELKQRDNLIRQQMAGRNVKYGIPRSLNDVIKQSEVVHYPMATVLCTRELKGKQEEYNQLLAKVNKYDPALHREAVNKNKALIKKFVAAMHFNTYWNQLRNYTKAVQELRKNKFITVQATKANLSEIKSDILKVLKANLEDFCCKYLGEKLKISTIDTQKKEDSVFIIKSFVHQIYSDLSSAYCSAVDLDPHLKELFRSYISEKSQIPPKYLTTFEFNRLEFDEKIRLNRMDVDRRALLIGFIIFFRIIIIDILKNYLANFEKLGKLGDPIPEVLEQKIKDDLENGPEDSKKKGKKRKKTENIVDNQGEEESKKNMEIIKSLQGENATKFMRGYKLRKKEIRANLKYNFNFLMQLLSYICKTAFANNPVQYRDHFKDKYLYKEMVFILDQKEDVKLTEENNKDQIEILEGVFQGDPECDLFIKENFRWIHMYQLNTVQFCNDFAKMVLVD